MGIAIGASELKYWWCFIFFYRDLWTKWFMARNQVNYFWDFPLQGKLIPVLRLQKIDHQLTGHLGKERYITITATANMPSASFRECVLDYIVDIHRPLGRGNIDCGMDGLDFVVFCLDYPINIFMTKWHIAEVGLIAIFVKINAYVYCEAKYNLLWCQQYLHRAAGQSKL